MSSDLTPRTAGPRRLAWAGVAALAGAMVLVAPWDQAISDWARAAPQSKQIIEAVNRVLALGPLLTLLVVIGGFPNWRRAAPAFLLSVCLAGGITQGVKWLVGRARPDLASPPAGGFDSENWFSWAGELQSFPSGDATLAAAIATVFALMLPRWRWLFAAFALAVMLQRVANARHFPSDVIAGATVGIATTLTCRYVLGRDAYCLQQRPSPSRPLSGWPPILVALVGAAAAAMAFPFDQQLSGALSATSVRESVNHWLDILGPVGATLTLAAFVQESRPQNWRRPLAAALLAVLLTVAATHALKFAVGRARPLAAVPQDVAGKAFMFDPLSGKKNWDSFPSGHTSHVVSVALVLARFFPRGQAYYLLMAAVVAVERIPTGWHYVSDLLAGAIVAVICFRLVDRWFGEPAPDHLQRAPDA